MSMPDPCVFCSIVARSVAADIVFEDDAHVVFFPLAHINPGHLLLVPRQHVDYLFDLSPDAYGLAWRAAARVAGALRSVTDARRIGVVVEGFSVPHAHIHLVPVNGSDEINPQRARAIGRPELERLTALLRKALGA